MPLGLEEAKLLRWAHRRPEIATQLDGALSEMLSQDGIRSWTARAWPDPGETYSDQEAQDFLAAQVLNLLGREISRAQQGKTSRVEAILAVRSQIESAFAQAPIEDYREIVPVIREVIPTGLSDLDAQIGGISNGELGIIAAPPGRGKSGLLIGFAVSALLDGFDVLYITVADQGRDEIVPRIDTTIIGTPCPFEIDAHLLADRHQQAAKQVSGTLWIADYTDRECRLDDIERAMITHPSHLVIVDHADDVLCDFSADPTVTRHSLRVVYMTLKKLAARFQRPIWTASQTHELSWWRDSASISELAEAKTGKATGASLVLVFSGGKTARDGQMICTIAKARRSYSRRTISVYYDWSIGRCWT